MFFKKKPTIATHPGRFHADDLFACAMLLEYLDGNAKIVRTDDAEEIKKADFVVDIGRIYDPIKNRFDHHQGGAGQRENGVSYAASGLVWKHFGERISGSRRVADIVDEVLITQMDITDTGDASPRPLIQNIYPYLLDNVATAFAGTWQEGNRDTTGDFIFLLPFARAILKREIIRAKALIEGEQLILEAYKKAEDKRYIVIDVLHPPLDILENKKEVLYVVSRDSRGGWAVYAVRKNQNEYGNRKDLPKAWAGKSGEELAKISGVPDAKFCHLRLFLAVAKSKEGAITLAKKATEY